jgi:hypothetical protein
LQDVGSDGFYFSSHIVTGSIVMDFHQHVRAEIALSALAYRVPR